MQTQFKSSWFSIKKVLLVVVCASVVGLGVYHYATQKKYPPILVFEQERDMQDLLTLFRANWYWLTASNDYSPEYVFGNLSPSKEDSRYMGKLHVNVLREQDNSLVGFTAYYMKNDTLGQLLFLCVDEKYRRKKYGEYLLLYGMDQLKKLGATKIRLFTRTNNLKAQALYKRIGFKEAWRDGMGGMWFEYKV